jgi:plasmid stabilization system protein ParE
MNTKLAGVRRIHLSRIRYHLYYRVASHGGAVEILALWHTSRGKGPGV